MIKELFLLISAILWLWSADPGPGAIAEWTGSYPIGVCGIANDKDIAAQNFHGIGHSIEDETGLYFYRDGERCRLYTTGFLRGWNEDANAKSADS